MDSKHVTVKTPEQVINFLEAMISQMEIARKNCDLQTVAIVKQRAYWVFLGRQGRVVGALKAFLATGFISENTYKVMLQKAINALIPTKIGV